MIETTLIQSLHTQLGITPDILIRQKTTFNEAIELISIGADINGRTQLLVPQAASAWQRMQQAALKEEIILLVVSAFRSIRYQAKLIQFKLNKGQTIQQIMTINAAPGYSEHHTGRALDITTPGTEPLSESFEQTPAFAWMQQHAKEFQFYLSYPKNNTQGYVYEPWHWAFQPGSATE